MKKRIFLRIAFLALSLCILAAGCAARQSKDMSLTEKLFRHVEQLRADEDWETQVIHGAYGYRYIAEGSISAVERHEDIVPLYVSPSFQGVFNFPAELWAVENIVFTMTVENAERDRDDREYEELSFNIPTTFRRISHWENGVPVLTEESFVYVDPEADMPAVGDSVTVAMRGSLGDQLLGDHYSLVVWNGERLSFGRIRSAELPPLYSADHKLESVTDGVYSLAAPMPENSSIFETVCLYPTETLKNMSDEAADAWSEDIAEGKVVSVKPYSADCYFNADADIGVEEAWDVEYMEVKLELDNVIKGGSETSALGHTVWMLIPIQAREQDGSRVIDFSGPAPEVGDTVRLWWTRSGNGDIYECRAAVDESALDIHAAWSTMHYTYS